MNGKRFSTSNKKKKGKRQPKESFYTLFSSSYFVADIAIMSKGFPHSQLFGDTTHSMTSDKFFGCIHSNFNSFCDFFSASSYTPSFKNLLLFCCFLFGFRNHEYAIAIRLDMHTKKYIKMFCRCAKMPTVKKASKAT
jgi:hypothetical protein